MIVRKIKKSDLSNYIYNNLIPNNNLSFETEFSKIISDINAGSRIVNNQNLIIENLEIGELSQTKCALCYMQNIANGDLIAEAIYRLNNLSIDALISSGELEQLIQERNQSSIEIQ